MNFATNSIFFVFLVSGELDVENVQVSYDDENEGGNNDDNDDDDEYYFYSEGKGKNENNEELEYEEKTNRYANKVIIFHILNQTTQTNETNLLINFF
jgi:hypothetical protein